MARFRITEIFLITNIGHVVAGEIIEGKIGAGDVIELINKPAITIEAVEYIDHLGCVAEIGLRVGYLSEDSKENLNQMIGETITIL